MSGLGGVSGRPGEPVIKLSSRHVVKSSSPSSRRHWLFGEACKVGEVGSKSPCSKIQVSKSPRLQIIRSPHYVSRSANIQIFTQIFQVIRTGYFAKSARFGKSAPSLHALQVSTSPSPRVSTSGPRSAKIKVFMSARPRSASLHVSRYAGPRSAGLHWRQEHGFVDMGQSWRLFQS